MGKHKKHKIKVLRTNTGINYSVTITSDAYRSFSGCEFFEVILSDGVLLSTTPGKIEEKKLKRNFKYFEVLN